MNKRGLCLEQWPCAPNQGLWLTHNYASAFEVGKKWNKQNSTYFRELLWELNKKVLNILPRNYHVFNRFLKLLFCKIILLRLFQSLETSHICSMYQIQSKINQVRWIITLHVVSSVLHDYHRWIEQTVEFKHWFLMALNVPGIVPGPGDRWVQQI